MESTEAANYPDATAQRQQQVGNEETAVDGYLDVDIEGAERSLQGSQESVREVSAADSDRMVTREIRQNYTAFYRNSNEDEEDENFSESENQINQVEVFQEDFEKGVDCQGINWQTFPYSRQRYRERRLTSFPNFHNLPEPPAEVLKSECIKVKPHGKFFKFRYTKMLERCPISHFQLRHLVAAPTKNDVFFSYHSSVKRWRPLIRRADVFMDMNTHNSTFQSSFRITALAANYGLVAVGGFFGELGVRKCEDSDTVHLARSSPSVEGIANHLDVVETRSGKAMILSSNNDNYSRLIDAESLQFSTEFQLPWAVNCSKLSPDRRLICHVGDDKEAVITDASNGDKLFKTSGHHDFSFSCGWSNDGLYLATGNQDKTARVYDTRRLDKSLFVLPASMGAVRSLQFTPDGRYLCLSESADFVHLFSLRDSFSTSQVIDFFGEIAGVAVTPDSNSLFIANSDETYGGLMEYESIDQKDMLLHHYR